MNRVQRNSSLFGNNDVFSMFGNDVSNCFFCSTKQMKLPYRCLKCTKNCCKECIAKWLDQNITITKKTPCCQIEVGNRLELFELFKISDLTQPTNIKEASIAKEGLVLFSCSICMSVLPNNSFECNDCSGVYCETCIDRWLSNNSKCPGCRKQTYSKSSYRKTGKFFQSLMDQIRVTCELEPLELKFKYRELEKHESICNGVIDCSICKMKIPKLHQTHQETEVKKLKESYDQLSNNLVEKEELLKGLQESITYNNHRTELDLTQKNTEIRGLKDQITQLRNDKSMLFEKTLQEIQVFKSKLESNNKDLNAEITILRKNIQIQADSIYSLKVDKESLNSNISRQLTDITKLKSQLEYTDKKVSYLETYNKNFVFEQNELKNNDYKKIIVYNIIICFLVQFFFWVFGKIFQTRTKSGGIEEESYY